MSERKPIVLNDLERTIKIMSEGNKELEGFLKILINEKDGLSTIITLDDMNIRGRQITQLNKFFGECNLSDFIVKVKCLDQETIDKLNAETIVSAIKHVTELDKIVPYGAVILRKKSSEELYFSKEEADGLLTTPYNSVPPKKNVKFTAKLLKKIRNSNSKK